MSLDPVLTTESRCLTAFYNQGMQDGCLDERNVPAYSDHAFWDLCRHDGTHSTAKSDAYLAGLSAGDDWRLVYWCEECGEQMDVQDAMWNDCYCGPCIKELRKRERIEGGYEYLLDDEWRY